MLKSAQEVFEHMVTIFVTRERRYRSLLAFSLLEVLIVIAIIGILSSIIVVRWIHMREYQRFQQCRANILEIANTLESQRASFDTYAYFYKKISPWGLYTGSNSARLMLSGTIIMTSSDLELLHLPGVECPCSVPLKNNLGNYHPNGKNGYKIGDKIEYYLTLGDDCYTLSCCNNRGRKYSTAYLTYSRIKGKSYSGFTSDP